MPTKKETATTATTTIKKRGRKPKEEPVLPDAVPTLPPPPVVAPSAPPVSHVAPAPAASVSEARKMLILLHLKCSLKDLQPSLTDPNYYSMTADGGNVGSLGYELLNDTQAFAPASSMYLETCKSTLTQNLSLTNLKSNTLEESRYANIQCCFWCTYEFTNPEIHLPKNYKKNELGKENIEVYGSFCSAECAYAYLLNEKQDLSTLVEKKQLFHYLYPYSKGIPPAPNPFYLLDKYQGTQTIQEYRAKFHPNRHQTLAQIWGSLP